MPNHRPILALALLAWLAGVALAVQAAMPRVDGDGDGARFHLAAALGILVTSLLAWLWPALYARGVRAELTRAADLAPDAARQVGENARLAERWAWIGLVALGGLAWGGVATHLGHLRGVRHGLLSGMALLVLLAAWVAEWRHLGRLRAVLLDVEGVTGR
jgi:hypothetical protein